MGLALIQPICDSGPKKGIDDIRMYFRVQRYKNPGRRYSLVLLIISLLVTCVPVAAWHAWVVIRRLNLNKRGHLHKQ